ncbi:MAG: AAA family ATPase [Pseudomonadales bacterium]|jgi:SpoVK/Ycf46/Vps4 family AAA+-type ATPase|nr:AAA family ATPase [Pseudomonadales bacterium]
MTQAGDLALMIESQVPIIVIESHDERRVLALLTEIAIRQGLTSHEWSAVRGLERGGLERRPLPAEPHCAEPEAALREIARTPGPSVYALCDLHPWFKDEPKLVRLLKEIALDYPRLHNTLVLVSHRIEVPPELSRLSASFRMALPDAATLMAIVREQAEEWSRRNGGARVRTDRQTLDKLIANLRGVNEADARMLIRHAIFTDGAINDSDLPELNRLKYELLDAEGVLHFEYDVPDLGAVAGLNNLKNWLARRRNALRGADTDATAADPDRPRGILLLGVQGSGKSLAARCIAGEMKLPLLRLDFANLYNKFIGETERNLRESLQQAERMAPCVLWMDELEKGIDVRGADNATSRRVLGTLLTWLAENRHPVFVVATANDIRALAPELLRKGRFDEIFFVDLPDQQARRDILRLHLARRGCLSEEIDLDTLAARTEGFTGAELEQAVVAARYGAAAAEGVVDTAAVQASIDATVPLSVTMAEAFASLRAWAAERTVPAG